MVFYCSPAYVIGFAILLLSAPPFGLFQLPYFFDPHSYAPPLQDPWDFLRSMIVPWLVVGAPLGAATLRLTLALVLGAVHGHEHGARRVRVLRAGVLPAHEAGAGPGARDRHPDAAGARAVGRRADRDAVPARRPRDRPAGPAD